MLAKTWKDVPQRVAEIVKESATVAMTLRKVLRNLPRTADPGYGYLYWQPDDKVVHAVLSDGDDQSVHNRYANALKAVQGVQKVITTSETHPRNQDDWVRIKRANDLGISYNPFIKVSWDSPNALATTLGGGLLAGGLGYGAGALLENLFPERYVQRGRLRKTLGMLGAGAGAIPGIWAASARARMFPPEPEAKTLPGRLGQGAQSWWRGFTTNVKDLPVDPVSSSQLANSERMESTAPATEAYQRAQTGPPAVREPGPEPPGFLKAFSALKDYPADEWFLKAAEGMFGDQENGAGSAAMRPVPLDAFGNAIWNDVRPGAAQYNPYGTKSTWGDNSQPMGTPPAIAAAAAGMVQGIGAQYGNPPALSPVHFIRGLATAGVDLATARVAGGLLGALGGLQPAAQEKLQDIGLWGGLIRGIVGSVFGR